MKPGDHPDFFRLPPPPGASRDSTIHLDRHGVFFHDGERVEKESLARALHRWVAFHPDDGRPILTNGYDWTYFTVEDTPLFVEALSGTTRGAPTLRLSDGTEEALDPTAVLVDEDGVCFARVKAGRALARFWRHAQASLAPYLAEDEPPRLVIDGAAYAVRPRPPRGS